MAFLFKRISYLNASLQPANSRTPGVHLALKTIADRAALERDPSSQTLEFYANSPTFSLNPFVGSHSPSTPGLTSFDAPFEDQL